jgi:GNAT superfamily N-acetyltransferase
MATVPDPTLDIRPVRDDDDLDDLRDGDDTWAGAELARRFAVNGGDAQYAFHVAEQDGRLVGYLDAFLDSDDNPTATGFAKVWVRPGARGHGVGTALWQYLLPLATERGARRLLTTIDAADAASLHWLEARGGTTGGTHLESRLELGEDLPLIPPPAGVSVDTLPDDAGEPEWRAAYDAHVRLMQDTPDAETNPSPMPFPIFRTLMAHPWQVCLGTTEDGAIVGLTSVFAKNQVKREVNTMLTAVNREWRNQGMATALKTAHALKLRDAGWRAVITQNMEGNDHILAANARLGFQPSATRYDAIYDVPQG